MLPLWRQIAGSEKSNEMFRDIIKTVISTEKPGTSATLYIELYLNRVSKDSQMPRLQSRLQRRPPFSTLSFEFIGEFLRISIRF